MHGLSILYRWFALLSVHISTDSLLPLSLNYAEWTRVGIDWLALWLVVYMAKKVFQWYFYVVTWTPSNDEFCPRCWAKSCLSVVVCGRNFTSLWERQGMFFFFLVHLLFNIYTEEEKQRRLLKYRNDKHDIFFFLPSRRKLSALLCFWLKYKKKRYNVEL